MTDQVPHGNIITSSIDHRHLQSYGHRSSNMFVQRHTTKLSSTLVDCSIRTSSSAAVVLTEIISDDVDSPSMLLLLIVIATETEVALGDTKHKVFIISLIQLLSHAVLQTQVRCHVIIITSTVPKHRINCQR